MPLPATDVMETQESQSGVTATAEPPANISPTNTAMDTPSNSASADATLGPLLTDSVFEPWYSSFRRQVKELMGKQRPLPVYRGKPLLRGDDEVGLAKLVIPTVHEGWFQSLPRQIREAKAAKNLRPLRLTSKPLAVKSIWGAYDYKRQGVSASAVSHVLIVAVAFLLSAANPLQPIMGDSINLVLDFDVSPYLAELRNPPAGKDSGGGGGGGQNSPLPQSKGRLPRFDSKQLAPPTPIIKNPDPKLSVEPTVIVQEYAQAPKIDMNMFGDPFGKIGPPSSGPGSGGGIGSGRGTGVGSGRGAGVGPGSGGGIGGGVFRIGGGVSAPRLTYKVEPEYSEEARKAKYQGTVVLAIEVWQDGKAHNIRVVRSLGLGLDKQAIEAVQQWRFVPGKKDNVPVRVRANVEVNFRLL